MQIDVMVQGYSQETLRAFLGIAAEMGLPISQVRSTPMGLRIPVELAMNAGLFDQFQPAEAPKPKRGSRAKKVEEPPLWDE